MTFEAPEYADWATAQPHPLWKAARDERGAVPAAPASSEQRPSVVVTRFAEVDAVLRDPDTFSSSIHMEGSGQFKGETIVAMGGDEHRRHRAVVASAFRPSSVDRWRTTAIEPVIHELLDAIAPRGRADLVTSVTTRFPVQVICTIIGLPRDDHEQFQEWAEAINSGPLNPEAGHAAADALTAYLRPVVEARRAEPTDDLVSALVHAEVDGERLTEDRLFGFLRLLLPAGAETTSRAMGSVLSALLTHPAALDAVRADRTLLPPYVEEALRWETPVAMVRRVATRDTEIDGTPVIAGTAVVAVTSSANHDERRWTAPDTWDPARPPVPHIAFGAGPHVCLGMSLARAELHAGVAAVLDRLPGLALAPGARPPDVLGYAFRGPDRLDVVWDPDTAPGSE
ncbi:MAG: cytochrome P450 [Acidimicrobiia bacterium]